MEKKLTKKELKELEQKQEELRQIRRRALDCYTNYHTDIEATKRFYTINPDETKMKYGKLNIEEETKLLRRYEALDFLKPYEQYTKEEQDKQQDRAWTFMRLMYLTDKELHKWQDNSLTIRLHEDDLWNDDIIWSRDQVELYLKLAKKFGYTRIIYTNRSSGALENLTDFVSFGAKVVGTCGTKYYENSGLILDISEINLEEKNEETLQ